jgi:hypothetical protein
MRGLVAAAFVLFLAVAVSACNTGRCPDGRSWSGHGMPELSITSILMARIPPIVWRGPDKVTLRPIVTLPRTSAQAILLRVARSGEGA